MVREGEPIPEMTVSEAFDAEVDRLTPSGEAPPRLTKALEEETDKLAARIDPGALRKPVREIIPRSMTDEELFDAINQRQSANWWDRSAVIDNSTSNNKRRIKRVTESEERTYMGRPTLPPDLGSGI